MLKRIRSSLSLLLATVLVASSWSMEVGQAADVRCDARLPENVYFLISVPNVTKTKESFSKTKLGQLFADPAFKPFLEQFDSKIEELKSKFEEEMELPIADFLSIPQGEITLAVMKPPRSSLAGVVMLGYGDSEKIVQDLLAKLEEEMIDKGAEKVTNTETSVEIYAYHFPESDAPLQAEFTYFMKDKTLVMASSMAAAKSIVQRWDGSSDDTFAQEESWKKVLEACKVPGEADYLVYVNPIDLLRIGIASGGQATAPAQMVLGFLPVLGLDGLKGVGALAEFDTKDLDSVGKSLIILTQPTTGIINMFKLEKSDLSPGDWVPANAYAYTAFDWDVVAAYKAVETMVDSFQGPGATEDALDAAEDQFGLHPKKELIDPLTGEFEFIQLAGTDEDITPTFYVGMGFKSEESAEKILAMLEEQGLIVEADEQPIEDVMLYIVNPDNLAMMGTSDETVIYVTYADESFHIGSNEETIMAVLSEEEAESKLVDSAIYKTAVDQYPEETLTFAYSNVGLMLRGYYELLRLEGIEAIDDSGDLSETFEGIDFSLLPEFSKISKYFGAQGGYMIEHEEGAISIEFTTKK